MCHHATVVVADDIGIHTCRQQQLVYIYKVIYVNICVFIVRLPSTVRTYVSVIIMNTRCVPGILVFFLFFFQIILRRMGKNKA